MQTLIIQPTNQSLTPHFSRGTLRQRLAGDAQTKLNGARWHLSSQSPLSHHHKCLHIIIQLGPIPHGRLHNLRLGQRRGHQNFPVHVTHGTALHNRLQIGLSTRIRRQQGSLMQYHHTVRIKARGRSTTIIVLISSQKKLRTKPIC
jgi:hypothetical protein